jgi:hypothetical protein
LIGRVRHYLLDLRERQRMAISLARGGAMMQARRIDLTAPATWEFSGFSQNGEDGIIDVLRHQLRTRNRYCVEIGASNGLENNCSWLVVAENYGGLFIEGDRQLFERARRNLVSFSTGLECLNLFVDQESAREIVKRSLVADPDIFSLDIDGMDYYIAQRLFQSGLRPKIAVVEYNSAFGAERSITVPYSAKFSAEHAHPSGIYFGVSLAAWKKFFAGQGYRFITVDQNGVNAFFVDPQHLGSAFLDQVQGLQFAENRYQRRKFGASAEFQFSLIADRPFVAV